MTLGAFLLLIFILYLIDKHGKWRQATKIVVALIVLCLLGVGGVYGWSKYEDYKAAKQQAAEAAAQQAQQAALEKRVKTCLTRNGAGEWVDVNLQQECEQDPDTQPPCWSKPDAKGEQFDLNNSYDLSGKRLPPAPSTSCVPLVQKPKKAAPAINWDKYIERHVKALYGTDIVTTEFGSLTCGHVEEGEVVTLLDDEGDNVKVKTAKGRVGWAEASQFEVVN